VDNTQLLNKFVVKEDWLLEDDKNEVEECEGRDRFDALIEGKRFLKVATTAATAEEELWLLLLLLQLVEIAAEAAANAAFIGRRSAWTA